MFITFVGVDHIIYKRQKERSTSTPSSQILLPHFKNIMEQLRGELHIQSASLPISVIFQFLLYFQSSNIHLDITRQHSRRLFSYIEACMRGSSSRKCFWSENVCRWYQRIQPQLSRIGSDVITLLWLLRSQLSIVRNRFSSFTKTTRVKARVIVFRYLC